LWTEALRLPAMREPPPSSPSWIDLKHRLIAINACCPGAGKSTLAAGMVDGLTAPGLVTRWLSEQDLISRPAFARCGVALTENDPAAIDLFIASAQSLVAEHADRNETWLIDSMLPGFVFAMGRYPWQWLARYRDEVARVFLPLDLLIVYLTGDPAVFLDRATVRSGSAFADRLIAAHARIAMSDQPGGPIGTAAHVQRLFGWADVNTRSLLQGWPGPVLILDASRMSAAQVRSAVMQAIDDALGTDRD
jgi:hypothetical protein